ncbi:MAG: DUF4276 family protein [Leptospiraceae bacterium]|nr:DUF4276 family protein [Leptospiraceae bacterium]
MSDCIEIVILIEGSTEQIFINSFLNEYMMERKIYMTPIQMSKPGQKGGDVKFSRVIKDISTHLKQRENTYISLFFDYYGVKEWPGLENAKKYQNPEDIAREINQATHEQVNLKLSEYRSDTRFIPNVTIHEFESLLFSDPVYLADALHIKPSLVIDILDEFGDPERINNSPETSPSKRIDKLNKRFKKTSTGISVAKKIGIEVIRQKCSNFNNWISRLEGIAEFV